MQTNETHDRNGVELRPGDAVVVHPEMLNATVRVIESTTTVTIEANPGERLTDMPAADLELVV